MSPLTIILVIIGYVGVLMLFSYFTARHSPSNKDFFVASHSSRWYVVALGMIGSSVSGISLVAVPAMVSGSGFTYIQMCLGFVAGYVVVATVLLPIFYKNGLTSIYAYLKDRFGAATYRTGAWFFIISKIITSSSKLYVAILVLQQFLFAELNIPIWLTVVICVAMIWLYTFRGGIKTIVFTDALQSVVLFVTIIMMIINMTDLLGFSSKTAIKAICESPMSHTFVFDDWISDKNFFKQFFSGVFIVIAMTGLSQDMMQTTLSCRNLKDAQKNMISYGVCFVPFNLLLLSLGVLMIMFLTGHNIAMPDNLNSLVPMFAANYFTQAVAIMFVVGIIAATFNSADSAMTSIATIFFVDILQKDDDTARSISLRKWVYSAVCMAFVIVVMLLNSVKNQNLLDTIYTIVGYAYGPLLGLFAFGLFTHWNIKDKALPVLAIASPLLTYALSYVCRMWFEYKFGYEILLINAAFMFAMMLFIRNDKSIKKLTDN